MTDDENEQKRFREQRNRFQERILMMMLGRKFGKLKVIGGGACNAESIIWFCRCDCDNVVDVTERHLFYDRRIACGECGPSVKPAPWARDERTVMQRFSNYMLSMRRMFKEIALILNLQDPNYEITDDETKRILKLAGWDALKTKQALKALMKRIGGEKHNV